MNNQTVKHIICLSILSIHHVHAMEKSHNNKDNDRKEPIRTISQTRSQVIMSTEKNRRETFRNTALATFAKQRTEKEKQSSQSTVVPLALIKAYEGVYAGRYPRVMQEMQDGTFDFQDRVDADHRIDRALDEAAKSQNIEGIERLQCYLEAAAQQPINYQGLTSTGRNVLEKFVQDSYKRKLTEMDNALQKKLKDLEDAGNNTQKEYEDHLTKLIQVQQLISFDQHVYQVMHNNLEKTGDAHFKAIDNIKKEIASLSQKLQVKEFVTPTWPENK